MRIVNSNGEVEYDEVNSFYLLVHVMKVLNYSKVCSEDVVGLR